MEDKSTVTDVTVEPATEAVEETAVEAAEVPTTEVKAEDTTPAEAVSEAAEAPAEPTTEAPAEVAAEAAEAPADAEKADGAKAKPSESDPLARLREADKTITRASHDAEAFKRRRDESDATAPTASKVDSEAARRDEEKKREEAAAEKRASLEYAESYRARVRKERESAATKKKEEEKERIKTEEKAAREREIAEGIEREREEARARGARMESLLEKVGADVSAVPVLADTPAAESVTAPATEPETSAPEAEALPLAETAATATEPVADMTPAAAVDAAPAAAEPAVATEPPAPATPAREETPVDYTITVDAAASERDLLYIEGAEACKITVGVTEPAPIPTPVSRPAPVAKPAPKREPAVAVPYIPTPAPKAEPVVEELPELPVSKPTAYGDFPTAAPVETETKPAAPVNDIYEEEAELIRHSKESDKPVKAKDELPEYPDFEPIATDKGKKKRAKGELTEEERDMLEFERASRRGKAATKSDDERIISEYETAEAEKREAATAEATEAKPTEKEKKDEPKEDKKPKTFFDKKAIEKNKQRQIKNDQLLIEHRIYDEIRTLEMDTRTGYYSFSAKIESDKERRARGKRASELKDARDRLNAAKKYEAEDNARYYYLVSTDVDKAKLPKSADRDELKETREELLSLLKKRDELNIKLIELYSISVGGKGKGAEGRFNAILAAKRKMYKQQMPTFKKYERARLSHPDKEKLYGLLDERTELYGELARVDYMIKKERAKGEAKKELKREKGRIVRKLDENKRAIIHYEKQALKRADVETEVNNSAIAAWVVLGIILVAAVLGFIFWDQIYAWLMGLIGSTPQQ